jgi:hypothetical protein
LAASVTRRGVDAFRTFGFVVLPRFVEPNALATEIDRARATGLGAEVSHSGDIRFQDVPMMTGETAVSLSLLDRAEAVARAGAMHQPPNKRLQPSAAAEIMGRRG